MNGPGLGPIPAAALAGIVLDLSKSAAVWADRVEVHSTRRTGVRMVATREYDARLLRWPPATRVTPHDHGGSIGAFSVLAGELFESKWFEGSRWERSVRSRNPIIVDRGVVHDVRAGSDVAISIHAYSPALTTMGFYEEHGQVLVNRQAVDLPRHDEAWSDGALSGPRT